MKHIINNFLVSIIRSIGRFASRNRGSAISNLITRVFREGHSAANNHCYNIKQNGEAFLLKKIATTQPSLFFDIGANYGDWSLMAIEKIPNITIHAFEAVPATAAILEKNCNDFANIKTHSIGLHNESGELTFYTSNLSSELSSSVGVVEDTQAKKITCTVIKGDEFLSQNNIESIDFVKIDVEGAEYNVLEGLNQILSKGNIKFIQVEYGKASILNDKILRHLYNFFDQYDYCFGKLWPNGVEFKEYNTNDENFIGPNYVACQKEFRDLLER